MEKKVLFVDDEPINLFLIEKFLSKKITLETANSGNEVLEKIKNNQADYFMVVSDLRMPSMNGFELLTVIKNQYPHIKRLLLTAYHQTEEITDMVANGTVEKVYEKTGKMNEFSQEFSEYLTSLPQ